TAEIFDGTLIPRGARLESDSIDGEPCRFRTCFDTRLWPLEVSAVDYLVPPLPLAPSPWNREVQAAIRVQLRALSPQVDLRQLRVQELRFFLGGSAACSNDLVEALFGNVLGIAFSDGKQPPQWLTRDQLEPIGYAESESLLPSNPRGLPAYR